MIIKTKVSEAEYIKLVFLLSYRRPVRIFSTLLGLSLIIFALVTDAEHAQIRALIFGLFFVVLVPILIYSGAKRRYSANLRLQEEIEYEFTDDRMMQRAGSFTAERDWTRTHKIEEVKNFFLIYESSATFNLVPHKCMTPEEINQLRYLLHHLKTGAIKKLK